jgi:hypothetical protein
VDRLHRRGVLSGLSNSRLAERYIEEGMRMEDHVGVVFRDGPAGRRAGLAGGPDVWEVICAIRSTNLDGDDAIESTADAINVAPRVVRVALGYYAEYPEEIEDRIRRHLEEADAAEAKWRREQNVPA